MVLPPPRMSSGGGMISFSLSQILPSIDVAAVAFWDAQTGVTLRGGPTAIYSNTQVITNMDDETTDRQRGADKAMGEVMYQIAKSKTKEEKEMEQDPMATAREYYNMLKKRADELGTLDKEEDYIAGTLFLFRLRLQEGR